MPRIIRLADCAGADVSLIGGKGRGLGDLIAHRLNVPDGFVVTTEAYRDAVRASGLKRAIAAAARESDSERSSGTRVRALFDGSTLGPEIAGEIARAYEHIGGGPVAVRSSATAEDMADASFAGQQDTYLWIDGADAVAEHVVRCWGSLFTDRAIAYRQRIGMAPEDLAMAVVVQRMVPAAAAGVMMTLEPVQGDRRTVYIEAAYGLGEGVVVGDVGADRFWVGKTSRMITNREIGPKEMAYRFDPEQGGVRRVVVSAPDRGKPSITDAEAQALATLGMEIEQAFGHPMDVEWAIGGTDPHRELYLLQARPETVWSQREVPSELGTTLEDLIADPLHADDWDTLHDPVTIDLHWSTDNMGEALPGVVTPLSWSIWGPAGDRSGREASYRLGAISRAELESQADDEVMGRIFWGRPAVALNYAAKIGDRMPGVSGPAVIEGILGRVPDDMEFRPTMRRYPIVAARVPYAFATVAGRLRALAQVQDAWWRASIADLDSLDRVQAMARLDDGVQHFADAIMLHTLGLMAVLSGLHEAVTKIVERAGVGDIGILSGHGGAEMAIIADLWRASRGEIKVEAAIANHGFHGPREGELSGRVWREDPTPLRRMIEGYAKRPDGDDPALRDRVAAGRLTAEQRRVAATFPRAARPMVLALLKLAAARLPLRGVGKRAYLQGLDVVRGSARRIGALDAAAGRIDDPEDVFYLTREELRQVPGNAKELVRLRREREALYKTFAIPNHFRGVPTPLPLTASADAEGNIIGIGVSAGVVEGTARVVTDPAFAEVEPDEVLVATSTDPSWASIMFISSALVVDMGGALSHAAVVARELGIPCVVNTRNGTRALHSGDRVRVDGLKGTVEILARAHADEEAGALESA